jgi:NAD(P)-dependent dehydrogenase (short-subunit alcohol dehydrogenase family)
MNSVIITGANVGIGYATAEHLAAAKAWHVILACRDRTKGIDAAERIRAKYPSASVAFGELDLFSLQSIERFAAACPGPGQPPLRGLILNAGGVNIKAKNLEFTEDGYEKTFQLNFFGHFVLTRRLLRKLEPPARIVVVTSDLHDRAATKMGRIAPAMLGDVKDLALGRGRFAKMHPMARYGSAKLFAVACANELARHLATDRLAGGITANSWNPGVVPTTRAGRDMPSLVKKIMRMGWFVRFMGARLSTEEEAARNLGGLLTDEKHNGVSGRYFDGAVERPSAADARDPRKAELAWEQASALARLPTNI